MLLIMMNQPTRKYQERILTAVGIGIGLSLFGDATLYTVLPDPSIAAQAGVSLAMTGILLGINRLVRILFNGPAGYLYDRLPRRKLMIGSLLIGAFSTLIYALGSGAVVMLIGRILWGAAWSGIWIGSSAIILDIANDQDRGWVNGRLHMWFYLGVAVSSFAGGLFTDLFTYRGGLLVSTGLALIGTFIWFIFLPETRPKILKTRTVSPGTKGILDFPWKIILPISVPLFAMRFVFAGVLNATTILWMNQYLDGGLQLGTGFIPLATLTGGFVAVRVLVSLISAPPVGALSDRLGRRWGVLAVLLLIGMLGIFVMSLPQVILAVTGALIASLTAGGAPSLAGALIGDQAPPEQQGRTLGAVYSIADLGSAIGPVFALWLIPIIEIGPVYRIAALIYGLAGVFALLMAVRKKHRP
jgi:MFS family permease